MLGMYEHVVDVLVLHPQVSSLRARLSDSLADASTWQQRCSSLELELQAMASHVQRQAELLGIQAVGRVDVNS